jgi:hypothetical protein
MLTTEQLARIVRLLKAADAVELKVSVPDADRRSAVFALTWTPDAIRQVVFDTPTFTDRHGVVVRSPFQGKVGDSIAKFGRWTRSGSRPPPGTPSVRRRSTLPGGVVCRAG